MGKSEDDIHLTQCLERIEAKLNRGKRSEWSNYDFDRLIDEIHRVTGVRLSLTTLKRVSGRVKYDSFPTNTTLNALARYAGFEDWRDFSQAMRSSINGDSSEPIATGSSDVRETCEYDLKHDSKFSRPLKRWFIAVAVVIPVILTLYVLMASKKKSHLDKSQFLFRADKVYSTGVPNSVVFHYDASKVPSDSVFIVQTWDISRKTWVSRDNHEHSAIYYYPGYFRTKLIVDGEIVKTHDLQIATDGWLCLAEQDPQPLYFSKEECVSGDSITVALSTLEKYNLSLHPNPPRIRMFNQSDMGDISGDSFVFETQVKNPFQEGSNKCQFVQVLIQCKDDVMIIPLAAKSCIGDLFLYASGYGVDSKHGDLSGFGADLNQWTTLRVESFRQHIKFFVNGKIAYEMDLPYKPPGVVGVQYRFYGPASVRGTRFESGSAVIALNQ